MIYRFTDRVAIQATISEDKVPQFEDILTRYFFYFQVQLMSITTQKLRQLHLNV